MATKIKIGEIANRYADALLQQALEAGTLESVERDVQSLLDTLASHEEFSRIIKSPALSKEDAKNALVKILDSLGAGDAIKGLGTVLCKNRRAFALSATLKAFQDLVDIHKGIVNAEVISAIELSDTDKSSVASAVEEMVGSAVNINHKVDASIIGGLIVKVGSKMLDASVQTKLKKLKLEMKGA